VKAGVLNRISAEKNLSRPPQVTDHFEDAEIIRTAKSMRMEPWAVANVVQYPLLRFHP
jgi:hypothetical protein